MYTVKNGGDVHRGDLVAISNSNDFTVGIYFGQGRGGTFQYFSPHGVVESKNWWEKGQTDKAYAYNDKPWKLTRIWKHYVNAPRDTRILKLNVDTISTNAASINNYNNTGPLLVNANQLYYGQNNNVANLYKNKPSNTGCIKYPLNFYQSGQFQNKKYCSYKTLPEYRVPISKPFAYRNYLSGLYHRTNHFSQSPNTYNTTTGSAPYG